MIWAMNVVVFTFKNSIHLIELYSNTRQFSSIGLKPERFTALCWVYWSKQISTQSFSCSPSLELQRNARCKITSDMDSALGGGRHVRSFYNPRPRGHDQKSKSIAGWNSSDRAEAGRGARGKLVFRVAMRWGLMELGMRKFICGFDLVETLE